MSDPLAAIDLEHQQLQDEQKELQREHAYLEQHPEDAEGHREHSRKLRAHIESVDQLLDGLERTASRAASTVNAPPLDVVALRQEWHALREDARTLTPQSLPSVDVITGLWEQLQAEATRQGLSVFSVSSLMAVAAVRSVPDNLRWLATSTMVGATRASSVLAGALLDHYRRTLDEARTAGFAAYAHAQLAPYVRAATAQFSPNRRTLTGNLLNRSRSTERSR